MNSIGGKIRELRIAKGISAKDLAIKMGKKGTNPSQYIIDIEKKNQSISILTLVKIAKHLDVDVNIFLEYLSETQAKEIQELTTAKPISEPQAQASDVTLLSKYIKALEDITELQQRILFLENENRMLKNKH